MTTEVRRRLSNRRIAAILGIDEATVRRDLKAIAANAARRAIQQLEINLTVAANAATGAGTKGEA
jgi:NADH/NAD ratio-sensing transcriptional regulator Rex